MKTLTSRSRSFARAVVVAGAVILLAPADPGAEETKNPYTGNPEAIADGKRLFQRTGCFACHGPEAEGGIGPDLTDDVWVYQPTDATLFNAIQNGRSGTVMAAWRGQLTADEIWKIIAFIRSKYQGDPARIIW